MEANASICMCVNGNKIEKSECADHLGHRISTNDNEFMCKSVIAIFWKYFKYKCVILVTHILLSKSKLFKMYCYSFHGTPLWLLCGFSIC